jgi:hypothetical protein
MHRLVWIFRNGHRWEQMFSDPDAMMSYLNVNGMLSRPDITTVFSTCDNVRVFYKGLS